MQESTKESPFFLMYGRDPRLPTATALSWSMERSMVDLEEYGEHLATNLAEAWKVAQEAIQQAQCNITMKEVEQFLRQAIEPSCTSQQLEVVVPTSLHAHTRNHTASRSHK